MNHKVFISYSNKDKITADKVCHVLEQNGLECWIAPRNIPTGEYYAEEIVKAIKAAKVVVLIFSKNSQYSPYVQSEIKKAFAFEKPIISFNIIEELPERDMEYFLKITQWLEAFPKPEDKFNELIESSYHACDKKIESPIDWNLDDFVFDDMSGFKRNYTSVILLFSPLYWASFIYMGLVSDTNIWKVAGLIYLIPSLVCIIFYFQIWGTLFLFYPVFMLFLIIYFIFWILAVVHGLMIRNDFLTRRAVLRIMPAKDELYDALYEEYSQIGVKK